MKVTPILAISSVLAVVALVAGAQPPNKPAPGTPQRGEPTLTVAMRTDKASYGAKDPIKFTLTAKNNTKAAIKGYFASGMRADFEILKGAKPGAEKVWQWSRGRLFAMIAIQTTVEPGKQLEYSETFTPGEKLPDDRPGITLAPGSYTAVGVLNASMGKISRPSAEYTFTVTK